MDASLSATDGMGKPNEPSSVYVFLLDDAVDRINRRLNRVTWRDVVVILTATVASIAFAQAFLPPAFILPSVAVGIGLGYMLRTILDPPRWQAIELLAWIVDFQERAERRVEQPEPPPDVVVAHDAYLEAYHRYRGTGRFDVSAWRAATEVIRDPDWRLPQVAMIALLEAVSAVQRGDPRWRDLLVDGRRKIIPFRLSPRLRVQLLAARYGSVLAAVVVATAMYLIFGL